MQHTTATPTLCLALPPLPTTTVCLDTSPPHTHLPSQELIKAHNGDITVESQVGVGSSFCVWLPISQADGALMPVVEEAENKDYTLWVQGGGRGPGGGGPGGEAAAAAAAEGPGEGSVCRWRFGCLPAP